MHSGKRTHGNREMQVYGRGVDAVWVLQRPQLACQSRQDRRCEKPARLLMAFRERSRVSMTNGHRFTRTIGLGGLIKGGDQSGETSVDFAW